MPISNFKDSYEEETRGVSVRGLLKDALEQADDIDHILISAITKNNEVTTGYSTDSTLLLLGALEISKNTLIEEVNSD